MCGRLLLRSIDQLTISRHVLASVCCRMGTVSRQMSAAEQHGIIHLFPVLLHATLGMRTSALPCKHKEFYDALLLRHAEGAVRARAGRGAAVSAVSASAATDSRKATSGGDTASSQRAKRSRRSFRIVSKCTSPALARQHQKGRRLTGHQPHNHRCLQSAPTSHPGSSLGAPPCRGRALLTSKVRSSHADTLFTVSIAVKPASSMQSTDACHPASPPIGSCGSQRRQNVTCMSMQPARFAGPKKQGSASLCLCS